VQADIVRHPSAPNPEQMHTFDRAIMDFLPEAMAICSDRGGAYGDTWALPNRVNTFKRVVLRLPQHPELFGEWLRLMDCAALIDTKHTRWLGGVKRDHTIDAINYEAMFGHLMEDYDSKLKSLSALIPELPAAQ
jgi:hypothetical protein